MEDREQRIALLTGASSGFGLLSAVALAQRGLTVFGSMRDLGRRDRLDAAAAEAGVSIEVVRLDVTDPDSIASAIAEVEKRAGPVDVLVNNAGYGIGGFVEDLSLEELRSQFETNFFGLVEVTKAVVPGMRERGWGRIINVSSVQGLVAMPGLGAYCASKYAVEGLSESMRHELAPHGVYVSLVEPGMFPTDIFGRNRRVAARMRDPASPNYEASIKMEAFVDGRLAKLKSDPGAVARVITLAATCERPRLRYLVGADARVERALHRWLPDGLWERAIRQVAGRGR